ncbi:MAG TPA: DUF2817 domain-containing protein [Bdellovibrionota bacterium]|jgi:hypothetical protein|nr:DUF2817 domain-containing protein [Bdellovibrionota bacterium]
MSKLLSELNQLESILKTSETFMRHRVLGMVRCPDGSEYPVYGVVIGADDPKKPTLGIFGGVHGLERIGSQLCLSWLESIVEMIRWDADLIAALKDIRIVAIPIVNPGGMALGMRSNPNGVDLMRNSPVEAELEPAFLLGGHRFSKVLPWFRGDVSRMEDESRWLCEFVQKEMFDSELAIAVDLHSGFGSKDRLWYPYARSTSTFPRLREVLKFKELLDRSYPNHVYSVEPQSLSYTTHGDLWDYLFDAHWEKHGPESKSIFLPWTLEMGSWLWLKKNPWQIFSALGPFNPMKEHRFKRTLRRHRSLLDFFFKVVRNHKAWVGSGP